MRWWLYILAGAISYVAFTLAYLPAQHAFNWLLPDGSPIVMKSVSGTLWNGSAKRTFYDGMEFGSLTWAFNPLSLLLGQINYEFDLSEYERRLAGDAGLNIFTGGYIVSDLKGAIESTKIPSLIGQSYVRLRGNLELDIQRLHVANKQLKSASGSLRWEDAVIQKPIYSKLGSLQFFLSGDDDMLEAKIKDIAGPFKVDGVLELYPDGKYRINGIVKPSQNAEQGLVSLLNNAGRPLADGSTQIDYSGQISY